MPQSSIDRSTLDSVAQRATTKLRPPRCPSSMYCAGLTGPLMSYADLEMFDFSENIAKDRIIKNLAKHQFSQSYFHRFPVARSY